MPDGEVCGVCGKQQQKVCYSCFLSEIERIDELEKRVETLSQAVKVLGEMVKLKPIPAVKEA